MLFLQRPGGQSQFSAGLAAQAPAREPLRELQAWIADHLDADLSVPRAGRARVPERAPLRARLRARDRADARRLRRRACASSARGRCSRAARAVDAVARAAGFGSAETLRRAFHRRLGVGPVGLPRALPLAAA